MKNIARELPLGQVDHHEVIWVLLSYFGHAANVAPFTYQFQKQGVPGTLIVKTTKDGKIETVTASDDLGRQRIEGLKADIDSTLLEGQTLTAGYGVLFSANRPVEGVYRYREMFVLGPVPVDAPRLQYQAGDHPFIISFSYLNSTAFMIAQMRRQERVTTLGRYLGFLLNGSVRPPARFTPREWILEGEPPTLTSRFAQGGYTMPTEPVVSLPLRPPAGVPPMVELSHEQYYEEELAGPGDQLAVPDNLTNTLDLIFGLPSGLRDRFDLAVAWFAQSGGVREESWSTSYAALVIALETLLETGPRVTCELCGQDKYASTRRFREFLRRYLPGIDAHPKVRDRLYKVRSELVHGGRMFEQDLRPWRGGISPVGDSEMLLLGMARRLVRLAMYNWLRLRNNK